MRIVYLYQALSIWGGLERVLVDKMNYLVRQYGYEVYIITSDQGNNPFLYNLDERIHHIDLNVCFYRRYRYPSWRRWKVSREMSRSYHRQLKELLSEIKPDILVCTSFQDIHSLLRLKGTIPLVVESHVNFLHTAESLHHQIEMLYRNFWIGKAEAVVTLTDGDAKNWRRVSNRVYVIPNIVHLNDTGLYSDCSEKRVLFAGRFEKQKNIGELICIWEMVHPQFPDWQLDLFGDGALWERYKQKAEALNINIAVHKPTPQILDVYRRSSIFVLTSLFEPFGLVIPEAMSCGLPVVSYDSPYGPASIISEDKDGFVVPMHNRKEFACRLCQLMSDEELRKKMGKHAIVSSRRFSADKIMPIWKQLFEQLTDKGAHRH